MPPCERGTGYAECNEVYLEIILVELPADVADLAVSRFGKHLDRYERYNLVFAYFGTKFFESSFMLAP